MSSFCDDRDLLAIEPVIFLSSGLPSQQIAGGDDGQINGTTFTSAGSNFTTAGITEGMVLCVFQTIPSEGNAYEILSVDSATSLTISVLRADTADDACPPPAGTGLSFHIRTFQPQIQGVCDSLAEKLRQIAEVSAISSADFADSAQLRLTAAYGTLSSIFVARAENASPQDAYWIKAEHYRDEFRKLQLQLRLAVDIDGNGKAERTRTLGNVTLRRV